MLVQHSAEYKYALGTGVTSLTTAEDYVLHVGPEPYVLASDLSHVISCILGRDEPQLIPVLHQGQHEL